MTNDLFTCTNQSRGNFLTEGFGLFHASLCYAKSPPVALNPTLPGTFHGLERQTSGYLSGCSNHLHCPDYLNIITFIMNCTMQLLRLVSLVIDKRTNKSLLEGCLSFIRLPNVNVFAILWLADCQLRQCRSWKGKSGHLSNFYELVEINDVATMAGSCVQVIRLSMMTGMVVHLEMMLLQVEKLLPAGMVT